MPKTTERKNAGQMEFSTFRVGSALCGINILDIQEINKHFEITQVPQTADYIEGVLNLRGRIVTVIDLGKKLGLAPVDRTRDNRNIIVGPENEPVGLLVNTIEDVIRAGKDDIKTPPANICGIQAGYFQGVLKTKTNLVGILDIDKILKE